MVDLVGLRFDVVWDQTICTVLSWSYLRFVTSALNYGPEKSVGQVGLCMCAHRTGLSEPGV